MVKPWARYQKMMALAQRPTPAARAGAALVAGILAFGITQLLLGTWWGAGWNAVLFSSVALGIAAGVAAATMKQGLAVVCGILGALWLLAEALVAAIGLLAAGLG